MPRIRALTRPVNPDKQEQRFALSQLEETLGGRASLASIFSDLREEEKAGPEVLALAGMLADPSYHDKSLAKLCSIARLSMSKFLQSFREAKTVRAYALAMSVVADNTPALASSIMEQALPSQDFCPKCLGDGVIPSPQGLTPCRVCSGKGIVVIDAEVESQKLAAQVAGLVKSEKGTSVQVNTNLNMNLSQVKNSVEFREATDRLLFPGRTRPAVDAGATASPVVEAAVVVKAKPNV